MTDLLYKEEVFAIVGAAMDVYNDLGPGFLENVYQEAMEMEVDIRKIPSRPIQEIHIFTKESHSAHSTSALREDSTDYQTPISDD